MGRLVIGLGMLLIAGSCASAQAPSADCSKFKRMSDGRWMSTIEAKIGNPKAFKILEPGLPIDREETIVGQNVSQLIDQLCGGAR